MTRGQDHLKSGAERHLTITLEAAVDLPPALSHFSLKGRRVLIRADLNVPLTPEGAVASEARLKAALPTLQYALEEGAAVCLLSHLGAPKEGGYEPAYSLAPVADWLREQLDFPVSFSPSYRAKAPQPEAGHCVLLENVRFNPGEKANDPELARQYAALGDLLIFDAFATSHRAQASTSGICAMAAEVTFGLLMERELSALSPLLSPKQKPLILVLGGSKLSTKLPLLKAFLDKTEGFVLGGGIATTLLAAQGYAVGRSLFEAEQLDEMRALAAKLPITPLIDFQVQTPEGTAVKSREEIGAEDLILDLGPRSIEAAIQTIKSAGTIIWNGPLGKFETPPFHQGTLALAQAISESSAYSVAGGGETIEAIEQAKAAEGFSFLSTGGGAFLAYLSKTPLPVLQSIQQRTQTS